ncbi:MAG: WD40 repeat domain-containing protein [Acidobacteriota bacterium]
MTPLNALARHEVIRAFERALRREAHVLHAHPELVWQQLFNRLQWEPEPTQGVLEPRLQDRGVSRARPWIRSRTAPRESSALVRTFSGHRGSVEACVLVKDDTLLVSTGDDGTVRMWDVATGLIRATGYGHKGPVHDCAASQESAVAVTAGDDGTVRLWSLATGQPGATLEGHRGPVRACAIDRAGRLVISAGEDATVRLWRRDGADARPRRLIADDALSTCAISPSGRFIAAAGKQPSAYLWDARDGAAKPSVEGPSEARACAFTPDDRHLLLVGSKNDVTVVDLETRERRSGFYGATKEHHRFYWGVSEHGGPRGMALAPDGERLLTAAPDNTLRLWAFPGGEEVCALKGHTDVIRCVAFGRTGRLAVSGGRDGTIRLWDLTQAALTERIVHADPVSACAYDQTGAILVAMWGDRTAGLLDPLTLQEVRRLGGGNVYSCAVSADGHYVATSFMGVHLNVHDLHARRIARSFEEEGADPSSAWIHACTFDRTGQLLVSANEDGTLSLWDVESARKRGTLEGHRGAVTDCVIDPVSNSLVSCSRDRTLIIWDLTQGRRKQVLTAPVGLLACAVSPDGQSVVAAGEDGSIGVWTAEGRPRWIRAAHTGEAKDCAVSPDSRLAFTVGTDKVLGVWDLATGDAVARVVMPGSLTCVAAHPSKPELVCGDSGGGLHRLELAGIAYGALARPVTAPPPVESSTRREASVAIRSRVELPANVLSALQLLIVAVPAIAATFGTSPPVLGSAMANGLLLASLGVAWLLMTRLGSKLRPAVPRCDGQVAMLTGLTACAVLLPGQDWPRAVALAGGVGIITGAVDLAAGQHREALLLKVPIGWAIAASVPVGYAIGQAAAASVGGEDPVAATAAAWTAGVIGGATVLPVALIGVAKGAALIRSALLGTTRASRGVLGAVIGGLTLLAGPGLVFTLGVQWALLGAVRVERRWSLATSPLAVAALLLAGFALLAWR